MLINGIEHEHVENDVNELESVIVVRTLSEKRTLPITVSPETLKTQDMHSTTTPHLLKAETHPPQTPRLGYIFLSFFSLPAHCPRWELLPQTRAASLVLRRILPTSVTAIPEFLQRVVRLRLRRSRGLAKLFAAFLVPAAEEPCRASRSQYVSVRVLQLFLSVYLRLSVRSSWGS